MFVYYFLLTHPHFSTLAYGVNRLSDRTRRKTLPQTGAFVEK